MTTVSKNEAANLQRDHTSCIDNNNTVYTHIWRIYHRCIETRVVREFPGCAT